ncbi:MAG: hypothetical protein AAF985_25575, partial [Bacteroidota bacterium]
MIFNLSARGESHLLVDQQLKADEPFPVHGQSIPGGFPWSASRFHESGWNQSFLGRFNATTIYQNQNLYFPIELHIDLGQTAQIDGICLADLHGEGKINIAVGDGKKWTSIYDAALNKTYAWHCQKDLGQSARFLKLTLQDPSANIGEILLSGKGVSSHPKTVQTTSYPLMEQFIGVNINTEDPPVQMAVFEFVREYHDWQLELGDQHPNDCEIYRWNPSNAYEGWSFDRIYQDIADNNIQIAADLKSNIPALLEYTIEDRPCEKNAATDHPASYTAHAEYMYQHSLRYGHTSQYPPSIQDRLGEPVKSGLGMIHYIEDWNEQDKYWMNSSGHPQQEAAYFQPFEYAAMLSADYDGHESSLELKANGQDCPNPSSSYPIGVKNADPTMKVVMGGLSSLNLDYVKAIQYWARLHREDQQFPADVLNFHHYSNNYGGQTAPPGQSAIGVSPEADLLYQRLKRIVDYRNHYLPGKELWLSEFGYDSHPASPQHAPSIGSFSAAQVQGQWIVRSFLMIVAAGFDKAQLFTLTDNYKGNPEQLFSTCGLLELAEEQNPFTPFPEFDAKTAWYYVYTMKRLLKGFRFQQRISTSNRDLYIYQFVHHKNPEQIIYALWSGTSKDHSIENVKIDLPHFAQSANLVQLADRDIDGVLRPLRLEKNSVVVPEVTESPVFLQINQNRKDILGCDCSIALDPSMIVDTDAPLKGNPYHLIDEQKMPNG